MTQLVFKNNNKMNKITLIMGMVFVVLSCKNKPNVSDSIADEVINETSKEIAYNNYGLEINDTGALSSERIMEVYSAMQVGDTLHSKLRGTIAEVCSKKGCWMKLDMGEGKIVRVTFKDYGFFMPLNAAGEVVVNGKAFVTETSVDDLKHYAGDAGETLEEIAAITQPEKTLAFEADGVLLKN